MGIGAFTVGPEFAEELTAEHFDFLGVVGGGVLFEGVIHVLDGAALG
jgi:hypothetical protein